MWGRGRASQKVFGRKDCSCNEPVILNMGLTAVAAKARIAHIAKGIVDGYCDSPFLTVLHKPVS